YFALPVGVTAFLIVLFLGYINVYLADEKHKPNHLHQNLTNDEVQSRYYQANVIEPLKEKDKTFSTLIQVEAALKDSVWEQASGRVMVYVKKDSLFTAESLAYGDQILIKMTI